MTPKEMRALASAAKRAATAAARDRKRHLDAAREHAKAWDHKREAMRLHEAALATARMAYEIREASGWADLAKRRVKLRMGGRRG